MENFVGTLIRRERLRQNLSQEGLCRGMKWSFCFAKSIAGVIIELEITFNMIS